MDMIFIAVFSVTTIGVICAAVLSIASKLMYVKVDERVAQLQECLPGANCGACGYPGCSGYAAALLSDEGVKPNLCSPGGTESLTKISAILGVEAGSITKKSAVVHCSGDCTTMQKKMDYRGIQSCAAAKQLFGGEGACAFGCLGFGDCKTVCPSNAVCIENGLARINHNLCTGCGLCVKSCPNNLISVEKSDTKVAVLCKSRDKGAVVRKKCSSGCIGCGKCVRECPAAAIKLEENLAIIDFEKCHAYQPGSGGCAHCVEVCVSKCIKPNLQETGKKA